MFLIMDRLLFGQESEQLAVKFLKQRGYIILARRFRTKLGEIDIVARDEDAIVFIEVRSRNSDEFGAPYESVDRRKQRHIINAAFIYLAKHKLEDAQMRFDIISVLAYRDMGAVKIGHIKNAFGEG